MAECMGKYFSEGIDFKDINCFDEVIIQTGSSFYEVIRVIDGVCLFFNEHIRRLNDSVRLSGLRFSTGSDILHTIVKELLYRNNLQSGNIKIVIHFAKDRSPVIFTYVIQHVYPTPGMYVKGIYTDFYNIVRKNPNVKRLTPAIQKKLGEFITQKGIYEALLIDEKGFITEGSKSNLFFIINNTLYTAPDENVLKGITRDKIFELCKQLNYNIITKSVSIKNLNNIEAAFITGTSPGVLPIRKISQLLLKVNNPLMLTLKKEYNAMIRHYIDRYRKATTKISRI
jgi:branched-chain amino acid aminotransferase